MIRHLRKDAKMSTYAGKYTFKTPTSEAKLWPMVTAAVMLIIGLIPGVGLLNLLLAIPVGFALLINFLSHKGKLGRVYFGFLLLAVAVIVPVFITFGILAQA